MLTFTYLLYYKTLGKLQHVVYEQNLHDEEVVIGYSKPQICALVAQQGPRAFLGLEVKKLWG